MLHGLAERGDHVSSQERLAAQRDEDVVLSGRIGALLLEVPLEPGLGGWVQGHEPGLAEFGLTDHQAVRREVRTPQANRFRHPEAGARQQSKERAVGGLAERRRSGLRGRVDELPDLFRRRNVRGRPWPLFRAEDRGRHFVPLILSVQIASESNDHAKPAGPLCYLVGGSGPLERDGGGDVLVATGLREPDEACERGALPAQGEARRPADGQVRVGRVGQHVDTSGQGCAIGRSARTSTLA